MTKHILILTFLLFTLCARTEANDGYIIPRIESKNEALLKSLDNYLREYEEDLDKIGVLVLKYDPLNRCYYLTHRMYKDEIAKWLPSYYTIYHERIVVIYTGFESELNFQDESSNELFKISETFFVDPSALNYHADIWKITIENNKYRKEKVDTIPLDY